MGVRTDVEWVIAELGRRDIDRGPARRALYARIDPLTRVRVRSRVEATLTDTALSALHAADEGHLHRLALLGLRGRSLSFEEVDEVERLFLAELANKPARGPSRHLASGFLAGFVVLALASLGLWLWGPDHWLDPTLLPVNPRAFEEGGRPMPGDAAVAAFFVETLPAFVIALDHGEGLEEAEARALSDAKTLLGTDAEARLRRVFAESRRLRGDQASSGVEDYLRTVDAFNETLEKRGLGYYLDAELVSLPNGAHVYLASFAVERVRFYRAGKHQVRALRLLRRDSLNFVRGVLGFTRPHLRDALVLSDRIDTWLAQRVIGGLAEGGRLTLSSENLGKHTPPGLAALEERAARAAHAELKKLAVDCPSLVDTSALFARRNALFRSLSAQARPRGIFVQEPLGYELDVSRYELLRPSVDVASYDELRRVAYALDDDDHRACFRALREPLLASVERHEVQHRIDFADDALSRLPAELERRIGPLDEYGYRSAIAQRALAETSAYLSELARGREVIKLNLALLAQFVLDRGTWSTAEYFACLVIFDGLMQELGLGAVDARDDLPTQRVASALGHFLAMDEAELSRASARLWQNLMGRKLPELQKKTK